ncbi:MAG: hypothetical protein WDO14_12580 [Bacteroidota bacterium]
MQSPKPNIIARIALASLYLLLLLYNCHRYILKVNFTGTSPTYSDTPFFWKILKYIILIIILAVLYGVTRFRKGIKTKAPIILLGLLIFFLIVNFFNTIIYGIVFFDELEYQIYFLLFLPFFFIDTRILDYIQDKLPRLLRITTWFLVLSQMFVVGNYFLYGRLPALAFESTLVRFGGLWDDPNGFGFMCIFLLYLNFIGKRYFVCLLLLPCAFLTYSLAAFVLLVMGFFYWSGLASLRLRKDMVLMLALFIVGTIIAVGAYFDRISAFIKLKQRSIGIHSSFDLQFSPIPLLNGPLQFHETWLYSFLFNYFPISVFAALLIFYFMVNALISRNKTVPEFYVYMFLVGSCFIPFMYDFPLNCFFMMFLALFFYQKERINNPV